MAIEVLPLSSIVRRLQVAVPQLRQVDGAVALEQAMKNGATITPAAFIVPLGESTQANQLAVQAVRQVVTTTFGVVLAVRDFSDANGASGFDQGLALLRVAVLTALIGFVPKAGFSMMIHAGSSIIKINHGTIWWQDKLSTTSFYRSSL